MQKGASPGLTHLAYRLPGEPQSLDDLEAEDLLASEVPFLQDVGFGSCYVQEELEAFEEMVIECGRGLLACSGYPHEQVGWVFRCTGLEPGGGAASCQQDHAVLSRFRYPVGRAQHALGLAGAASLALSQQGCSGLLSGLFVADRLLRTTDAGAVLCLAGDALPRTAKREILYNVMSDAAAAVLVERQAEKNRIRHFYQHTVPYYWDTPAHLNEILASYFPLAQRVILRALEQAGLSVEDVSWFVPHNVSYRSWKILADLLRVPMEKIWSKNIARVGHTVSCDHVINLCDMEAEGALRPGDLLLLFTFGFGANWTCMILEH